MLSSLKYELKKKAGAFPKSFYLTLLVFIKLGGLHFLEFIFVHKYFILKFS